jgi:ankyrin repeat protein
MAKVAACLLLLGSLSCGAAAGEAGEQKFPLQALLYNAARSADASSVDRLKALVEAGTQLEAKDERGLTPLHVAALHGQAEAAKILAAAGASIEALDNQRETPLHLAAMRGHAAVIKLLVEAGAPLEAQNQPHSERAPPRVGLEHLLAGASLEAKDGRGYTPLHVAADRNQPEAAKALLEAGASLEAIDEQRETPLHLAAWRGHAAVMRVLLDAGAPTEAFNEMKRTALHLVAHHTWSHSAHPDDSPGLALQLLLQAGAKLDAKDINPGATPLHYAAWRSNRDDMRALVGAGASLKARDNLKRTPLDPPTTAECATPPATISATSRPLLGVLLDFVAALIDVARRAPVTCRFRQLILAARQEYEQRKDEL